MQVCLYNLLYMEKRKWFTISTRDIVFVALSAALIAVGAFIKIPFVPVPLTLQWFFVMVSAIILGARLASLSVLIYVLLGLTGIPVFTSGGGFQYVLMPTFGYFIGFFICSILVGVMASKTKNNLKLVLINVINTVILYVIGLSYYLMITVLYAGGGIDLPAVMLSFLVMPLPGDIIKSILAAFVGNRVRESLVLRR